MKTVRLVYPVITFNSIYIEVSEDRYGEIQSMCQDEQADYIISELDQSELDWIPNGKKGLVSALDADYASIKAINN